jgi:hypothetical protein
MQTFRRVAVAVKEVKKKFPSEYEKNMNPLINFRTFHPEIQEMN